MGQGVGQGQAGQGKGRAVGGAGQAWQGWSRSMRRGTGAGRTGAGGAAGPEVGWRGVAKAEEGQRPDRARAGTGVRAQGRWGMREQRWQEQKGAGQEAGPAQAFGQFKTTPGL